MNNRQNDIMGSVELPDFPEIISKSDAIVSKDENGSKTSFYIFPEFEIHINIIAPKAIQGWHYHKEVEEIILVTEGEINLLWLDDSNQKIERALKSGDLCRLGRSKHTIANHSDREARFLVYKLVSTAESKHDLIKTDRYNVE